MSRLIVKVTWRGLWKGAAVCSIMQEIKTWTNWWTFRNYSHWFCRDDRSTLVHVIMTFVIDGRHVVGASDRSRATDDHRWNNHITQLGGTRQQTTWTQRGERDHHCLTTLLNQSRSWLRKGFLICDWHITHQHMRKWVSVSGTSCGKVGHMIIGPCAVHIHLKVLNCIAEPSKVSDIWLMRSIAFLRNYCFLFIGVAFTRCSLEL
jgi:hypothetical protein